MREFTMLGPVCERGDERRGLRKLANATGGRTEKIQVI